MRPTMLILLDNSPSQISEKAAKHAYEFGQLRTPLTSYKKADRITGIDNGCFARPLDWPTWLRIIDEHRRSKDLKFVAMPDVVGSARRTLELYSYFAPEFASVPRALVCQDGQENLDIPWDSVEAVFIGGTNAFKDSEHSMQIAKAAKILGKWVHVGRVNSVDRVRRWKNIADSCDGSGLSRYDHMLAAAVKECRGELVSPVYEAMPELWDGVEASEEKSV